MLVKTDSKLGFRFEVSRGILDGVKAVLCILYNGRHEYYQERRNTPFSCEVYQRCLICQHRTRGWRWNRR